MRCSVMRIAFTRAGTRAVAAGPAQTRLPSPAAAAAPCRSSSTRIGVTARAKGSVKRSSHTCAPGTALRHARRQPPAALPGSQLLASLATATATMATDGLLVPALAGLAAAGLASVGALLLLLKADCSLGLWWRSKPPAGAFKDQVVWITGASQGIGELLALHLAAQGAHLILSARNKDNLEAVAQRCRDAAAGSGSSIQVLVLPLDLTGPFAQLEAAAAAADAAFEARGVDYLMHNAGASQHALCWQTNGDVTRELVDLNAMGPILLTRAALPHLIRRGKGRLVVVASMAALVPSPGQAVYAAAKMALRGYFLSVATEVAGTGVSVTLCYPGPTATGGATGSRMVYGAAGKVARPGGEATGKLSPSRVVSLIAAAAAAGVEEAWMAKQPVLLLAYVMQAAPGLAMWVLKKVGPARAKAIAKGESGYDVAKLVSASAARGAAKEL